MTRYCVHACDDDPRQEHLIVADGPAEAAVIFVERWLSPRPGETEVALELRDIEGGAVSRVVLELAA